MNRPILRTLPLVLVPFAATAHAQVCSQLEVAPTPTFGAELGFSVAVDGDLAVAGAPEARQVVVWRRTGGAWTYLQTVFADGNPSSFVRDFGWSLDLDGGVLAVGCVGADQAQVFEFDAMSNAFVHVTNLTGNDTVSGDAFGQDISLEGDTLYVSATSKDNGLQNAGAVYVYDRSPAGWAQSAVLTPNSPQAGEGFGVALASDGDRLAVGAHFSDAGTIDTGAAYVFSRGLLGWTEEARLLASDGAQNDFFGVSIAMFGDMVVVGAEGDDDNGQFSGSAYVYMSTPALGFQEMAKLVAPDGATNDDFGFAVACHHSIIDVAARAHQTSGAVYRFTFNPATGASLIAKFSSDAPTPGETFGSALAIADDGMHSPIIGAAGHSVPGAIVAGAVYFPTFSPGGFADCNGNLIDDSCDLASGNFLDVDHNGTLDVCEAVGTVYCTPNATNSTGTWSKLLATGSNLVASNDLMLLAADLPAFASGYFIFGGDIGFIAFPAGSQGILCLSGGMGRFDIQNSGAAGTFAFSVDLNNMPGGGAVFPGQTWYFQGWHRDINPTSTSNFTEAVEIQFQ